MKKKFIVVLGMALIVLLCLIFIVKVTPGKRTELTINSSGKVGVFQVEVVSSVEERERGLMYRDFIGDDEGMLFVFQEDAVRNFWMKNTYIPLDILFLDNEKKIVHLISDAEPCLVDTCASYSSLFPTRYVLEIRGGSVREKQIRLGDQVSWTL